MAPHWTNNLIPLIKESMTEAKHMVHTMSSGNRTGDKRAIQCWQMTHTWTFIQFWKDSSRTFISRLFTLPVLWYVQLLFKKLGWKRVGGWYMQKYSDGYCTRCKWAQAVDNVSRVAPAKRKVTAGDRVVSLFFNLQFVHVRNRRVYRRAFRVPEKKKTKKKKNLFTKCLGTLGHLRPSHGFYDIVFK